MGKQLAGAEKEVLVEIVRFTQKNGLKGAEGGWKDFLARNDKKFGASVSDPKKRSRDVLLTFLLTFSKDFQKYFSKLAKRHKERRAIEQYMKDFPEKLSPEQKLVQLTTEHPEYRKNYNFPSHQEGWKVMRMGEVSNYMNSGAMLALDCEMVLCHDGTEAVVRVCVVDNNLEVKLDKLVHPFKAIADYRTNITGVSKKDLEGVTCSLVDVQKSLKKILSKGNILIGHSLSKDLHALKFDYTRVIDTAYIFKYANLPSTASASLNSLCKSVLGYFVREEGEPHNCLKDAEAAMNLVIAKLKHGCNDPIEVAINSVPESDRMKLLAHRIPVYLPCQELLKIFTGNPSIDEKTDSRIRGDFYSTCVLFKLERVFRRIDAAEKSIRYGFDPVEQHLDDALQDEPDVACIHSALLAVDADLEAIKSSIRESYNLPCDDGGGDQDGSPAPSSATGVLMTKKMGEIRRGPQMRHLRLAVGGFEAPLRGCVLCLAAFPEGAVIKKRLLIHWWLGEGFVSSAAKGKERFQELADKGFLIPVPSALCGTVHRCTVRPWMRDLLISAARNNAFLELDPGNDLDFNLARRACLHSGKMQSGFSAEVRAIYNIDQKYVELDEGWFAGKKELRTLQLGQWREFGPLQQIANPMDSHIEVSGVESFADMESCKSLRYISFRGISRIESLPDSIGKLRTLVVLDLRACHNLEELGQGITKLDRLEYLDLSECHLLVGMPKGLGRLTRLEVLKGFVVANSSSKDPCHLNELTKLEKLRKLSIVIGKMAVPTDDEFLKLGEFKALESLKIRWGVLTSESNGYKVASAHHSVATMEFALPPNLNKLDLRCFPLTDFAQWVVPKGVKKLYIRGGKLTTLGDEEAWEAEVLRLRFLNDLQYDRDRLQRSFRKLKPENTEIHACRNFL